MTGVTKPRRVLVTAFGAFPGAPANPTLAISKDLVRRHAARLERLGVILHVHELPVRFAEVESALDAAIADVQPDLVLHLGLAGRRKALSVETRALNRLGTLRPDAGRRCATERTILRDGPAHHLSRWPSERIRAAMARHAPTHLSIDAGDYVCNQTLFLTLSKLQGPAGFIHVPHPRRRNRAGPTSRPELRSMVEAVAAAILVMSGNRTMPTRP